MVKLTGKILARVITAVFFLLLLYVIIYKAIHVPITHDEKSASLYYPQFTVWQIMMYTDSWPSNHILNTLCIKFDEYFLGIEPWTARLHSVLSFVIFFGVIYLTAKRFFNQWWLLFCLPFFVMFCNPFLLDFYGLARGYGLSNAMLACSVYSLLVFAPSFRMRWYYVAIVFAMLAAYANFTLLIYWAAVQILLVCIMALHNGKLRASLKKTGIHVFLTALLAAAFLALCYGPLYKMQSTNQFIYWSRESFFKDTLLDQVIGFRYGVRYFYMSSMYPAVAAVIALIIAGIIAMYKIWSQRMKALSDPLVILLALILLVWAVNMLQTILLGTPYLTSRTALSYYVLFAFVLMFLIRDISKGARLFRQVAVPVIILLFALHLSLAVTLKSVREWWFDANTYTVTDYLKDYKQKHPGMNTVDLNTNWLFNPSFDYYHVTGKTPWLNLTAYHKEVDTASQTLFYYATTDDAVQLKNYTPVFDFPQSGSVLMISKQPLNK